MLYDWLRQVRAFYTLPLETAPDPLICIAFCRSLNQVYPTWRSQSMWSSMKQSVKLKWIASKVVPMSGSLPPSDKLHALGLITLIWMLFFAHRCKVKAHWRHVISMTKPSGSSWHQFECFSDGSLLLHVKTHPQLWVLVHTDKSSDSFLRWARRDIFIHIVSAQAYHMY